MTAEQQKVYMDELRKYQEAYNAKQSLMNAGMTNQANGINQWGQTIDNAMAQVLSMGTGGMGGGMMGGLMGGGKNSFGAAGASAWNPNAGVNGYQVPPQINYSLGNVG
jgi:hypothetical protein